MFNQNDLYDIITRLNNIADVKISSSISLNPTQIVPIFNQIELSIQQIQQNNIVNGFSNPYYKYRKWDYGKQYKLLQKIQSWYDFIEWQEKYINNGTEYSVIYTQDEKMVLNSLNEQIVVKKIKE